MGNEPSFEKIDGHDLPHSLALAHELEGTDDDELIREKLGLMLESIEKDIGTKFVSNVNELYKSMQAENCLVRTERLSRVLETVELESPLVISDENEEHFANAVIPSIEGIKIALSEGLAPGPVRIMVGFGKTIIGFKTENVLVEEINFSESEIRDSAERKFLCRHVTGKLSKEDIRYIVMRIPSTLIQEKYLTDNEKTKKPKFIFRGMALNSSVHNPQK